MLFEPSKEVTPLNGPRPAGKPTECFYCKQQIGDEHAPDCVCRVKVVMVKVEMVIPAPFPRVGTPTRLDISSMKAHGARIMWSPTLKHTLTRNLKTRRASVLDSMVTT
jgi:hypothetical protein